MIEPTLDMVFPVFIQTICLVSFVLGKVREVRVGMEGWIEWHCAQSACVQT